jgi:hypothetical protein
LPDALSFLRTVKDEFRHLVISWQCASAAHRRSSSFCSTP